MRLRLLLLPVLSSLAFTASAARLGLMPVADGFTRLVGIVGAPDGRLVALEQAGIVKIIDQDGTVLATPFIDISDRVDNSTSGKGLMGLAFHPDFPQSGSIFVNYVHSDGAVSRSRISRFQIGADPDVIDTASEDVLLTIDHPLEEHWGGHILFGPDGYLYVPMGDGGGAGDPGDTAGDPGLLLGKLIRIDVDSLSGSAADCAGLGSGNYTIPANNPFVDGPGATCDEIWAMGLRNPWRSSFDRLNGHLFIGDVGEAGWEEIDFQDGAAGGGQHYGWRCYEGNQPFDLSGCGPAADYTFPLFEYAHAGNGCSVIAGYVYRGTVFPALDGRFLLTDFCSGVFWDLADDGGGTWTAARHDHLLTSGNVAFAEAADGELYLANLFAAAVYRIVELGAGGTGRIGDFVWDDLDGDGVQDAGENGRADVAVELQDCSGVIHARTTTDADGRYLFDQLAAASYRIRFGLPPGYRFSPRRQTTGGRDSDPFVDTGLSNCLPMAAGQTRLGIDAGVTQQAGGSAAIGDYVWADVDGDGLQDAAESGQPGVTVELQDCSGNSLQTTTSGNDGEYLFANLVAGRYRIRFVPPPGLAFSPRGQGPGGRDSNADPATGLSACVTMSDGQTRAGIDAGLVGQAAATGRIGDYVWHDGNGDGIQDPGESGLAGVTVNLRDCGGALRATATTDANGAYLFPGLAADGYRVHFVAPPGFVFSPRGQTTGGRDSDPNPNTGQTACRSLAPGQSRLGIDAGLSN